MAWKENFNSNNFWPSYSDPQIFITSQWQPDKDTPSFLYLAFRILIFLSFFVIWILSFTMESEDGKQKWAIYLTNWGLTLCVIQSFFASLMLACVKLGSDDVLKLYKTYWVVNSMATTVAFTISFVYWTLIHRPEFWSTMNFMVHGMNSILIFIDFCLVAHPVRLLHFIYPICITFVYVTMTAIYYACGGLAKNNDKYIYPILKWDQTPTTIGYCIAIMILIIIINSLTFLLYLGRVKLAKLCFGEEDSESAYYYGTNKV